MKQKRRFTAEEKLSILRESEREGFTETCRKYNLAPSVLSYWKKKYLEKGKEGLKGGYKRIDPNVRALEEENERLKRSLPNRPLKLNLKMN